MARDTKKRLEQSKNEDSMGPIDIPREPYSGVERRAR